MALAILNQVFATSVAGVNIVYTPGYVYDTTDPLVTAYPSMFTTIVAGSSTEPPR